MSITDWNPKDYHDDGRTLEWGKSLTPEQKDALRGGEIFTLLDRNGDPHSRVLMDSYDQTRQGPIQANPVIKAMFGVPDPVGAN